MTTPPRRPGEPYCSNCGYTLEGLTSSACCPECGRPLVEVLVRATAGAPRWSVRRRSAATLFGLPVIDIALGPRLEYGERMGTAKGIIAIGDKAFGGIAIGGLSCGIVAVGGLGVGLCTIGGVSLGLLTAFGGGAVGGFAFGGLGIGVMATGGGAIGIVAQGGATVGVYARGDQTTAVHSVNSRGGDPEAVRVFGMLEPVFGPGPVPRGPGLFAPIAVIGAVDLSLAGIIALAAMYGVRRAKSSPFARSEEVSR